MAASLDDLIGSLYPQPEAAPTPEAPEAPEAQQRPQQAYTGKLGGPRTPYDDLIYEKAIAAGQDPNLIKAQIWAESNFNPKAVSPKDARGLTQFIPGTWARYGKGDPFDPSAAIDAQLAYNADLGKKFGGNTEKMLAAYNWGENRNALKSDIWKQTAPPETRDYVNKILQKYSEYSGGATPTGSYSEPQQQPQSAGVYELELPNGGILTVPNGVDQQAAIAEAAKEHPELSQYLWGNAQTPQEAQTPEAQTPEAQTSQGNVLPELGGNLLGGGRELVSSLYGGGSHFAEMLGYPEKAAEWQAKSKEMGEQAKQDITEIPPEQVEEAYKEGTLKGVGTEFLAKGAYPLATAVGRYGANFIPGGAGMTAGKLALEHVASMGDITRKAKEAGVPVDEWKAELGASVSSLLATVGLPHTLAGGAMNKVFGGAAGKVIERAYEKGGVEEASKLLGNRFMDVVKGLGTSTGAGFGVMAGTEAAQRAALDQPLQTPAELGEELESAAWMSPVAIPGALKAKGARQSKIDYLQQQKEITDRAAEIDAADRAAQEKAAATPAAPNLEEQARSTIEGLQPKEEAPPPPPPGQEEQVVAPPPGQEEQVVAPPPPSVQETPVSETPTPYYEDLGLSSKNNAYKALAQLDVNNPEHHATIVQVLEDAITNPRLKVKDVDAMTALRDQLQPKEAPSAEQIPETGAPDGSRGPQPIIREEGRDQTIPSEGVEPSGQRIETPEIKIPEEKIEPPKAPETALKKAPLKAPEVEEAPLTTPEPEHPLTPKVTELVQHLGNAHAAMRELTARKKAATAAGDTALVSETNTKIQSVEGLIRKLQTAKKTVDTQIKSDLETQIEAKAAAAREEAAKKVQEQGGYEFDLIEPEVKPTTTEAPKPKPPKAAAPTEDTDAEALIKRIAEMQAAKAPKVEPKTELRPQVPLENFPDHLVALHEKNKAAAELAQEIRTGVAKRAASAAFNTYKNAVIKHLGGDKYDGAIWQYQAELGTAHRKESRRLEGFDEHGRELPKAPEVEAPKAEVPKVEAVEVTPKEVPEVTSAEIPKWAQSHADDTGGAVVHHKGDIALVQGFSVLNGKPVFAGAKKDSRTRTDIESYTGNLFTPEEKAELVAAKNKWLEADAAAYAKNPDGPFKKGEKFAASPNVPPEIQEIAKQWQNMLGIGERIHLTTVEDAKQSKHAGPYAAIPSQALDANELGSKRRLSNGDFVIAYKPSVRHSRTLETISHEMGHALMDTRYKEASPEVRKAIDKDFETWLESTKGKTAKELVQSLRAHTTGKLTGVEENLPADKMGNRAYWHSRSEWFADQVSRWATTDKKPLGVVEQFFSRLAKALKQFFLANRKYLPTKNMTDWLNSLGEAHIEPTKKEPGKIDTRVEKARSSVDQERIDKLIKKAPSSSEEFAANAKDAAKGVFKVMTDSESRSDLATKARQQLTAQSAPLAKKLQKLETYGKFTGIRADLLRNQMDGIGHLFANALRVGAPDISEGGMMKIKADPKLALHKWFTDSDKLDVDQDKAMAVLRVLMGEQWAKESEAGREKVAQYRDYAATLKAAAKTATDKNKTKYNKLADGLIKEAKALEERHGEAPMEGLEKLVSPEDTKWAHDLLRRSPKLQEWVDRTHAINREAVDFLVKTGVLDKATAADWKSRPYIPLFKSLQDLKDQQDENLRMFGGSAKSLTSRKAIKGGTHQVNVPENMLRSWMQMYTSGYKNHVRGTAIKQMRLLGDVERTHENDPLAVLVKRDGKNEYWKVPDKGIAQSLEMGPLSHWVFNDLTSGMVNTLRFGAIKNPVYWIRSLTREPLTANFTSRTGFVNPATTLLHTMKALVGMSPESKELFKYGTTGYAESQLEPENFSKAVTKTPGYKKILDTWNHIHSSFDAATRVSVFNQAKKEGAKLGLTGEKLNDFAAMKASEFANFSTKGANQVAREMGRMTPFFNASLNSLDNLARNATGMHLNAREKAQAKQLFWSRAVGTAYMTGLYTLAMLNDPKYRNASDSEWTMNYFMPSDKEDRWTPVAAGFEPAFLFKFIPELLIRTYTGNLTPEQATGIGAEVAQSKMLPPMMPMLPALMAQLTFGYDVNLGREVESIGSKRLPAEYRDKGASEIAKKLVQDYELGKLGVSPVKMDALGRGVFAELYTMSAMMADLYLASKEGVSLYDKDVTQKYPVAKAIYTNPKNVEKAPVFYSAAEAAEQMVSVATRKASRGFEKEYNKIWTDPESKELLRVAPQLRQLRENIQKLDKSMETLENTKTTEAERQLRYNDMLRIRNGFIQQGAEIYEDGKKKLKKEAAGR